jgi:hypothetical protein
MFLMVFWVSSRCLTNSSNHFTQVSHDFIAALRGDPGLLLDAYTVVHLRLDGIACCRNKLCVTPLDCLQGIGEHLGDFVNAVASRQHVTGERVSETVGRAFNTGAMAKVFGTLALIDTAGERCAGFWVE